MTMSMNDDFSIELLRMTPVLPVSPWFWIQENSYLRGVVGLFPVHFYFLQLLGILACIYLRLGQDIPLSNAFSTIILRSLFSSRGLSFGYSCVYMALFGNAEQPYDLGKRLQVVPSGMFRVSLRLNRAVDIQINASQFQDMNLLKISVFVSREQGMDRPVVKRRPFLSTTPDI